MNQLSIGVLASTHKKHEKRAPLHPAHLPLIDASIRSRMFLESGYGSRFGFSDEQLAPQVAGLLPRDELIRRSDLVMMFKATPRDMAELRDGQILWGAPHFAQNMETTQLAIDRKLTVISKEAMRDRPEGSDTDRFVFHRVSEIAGYCSVQHALQCLGRTGAWGRPLEKAVVLGFGSTGQGAARALQAHGVRELSVVTQRPSSAVTPPDDSARMAQLHYDQADPAASTVTVQGGGTAKLAEFLAEHDIVVNCVMQDIDAPQVYLTEDDLPRFPSGALVVDVSCDVAMGFGWARPTSFDEPLVTVGDHVRYYAVDHSPSLLWDSATWELSSAALRYLPIVADPQAWDADETVRRALEVRDGVVQNPSILAYQGRSPQYPHATVE
ncbi:alanine dehydrogenase [Streptomyces sp. NBC_00249]|uniref:alanine dehydrogenase n=1 Tax=Streptomyces sp. NBC_00249 TaxID=2975690 RepID=UPI00224CFDD8|nr:alanine dehydrogenase [Streptomyces sp. NBC_00249]MCX5192550.1 alanine dehydrogenase [Streptomyces sp. NBC_00249]